MAEPGDGLRDLLAIDQGDDLLARAQLLDRQFPVRGPDHRAARVADSLDHVTGRNEGCPSNGRHVVHREHGGAGILHRQHVASERRRIAGEVGAGDNELVAPCDVRDRLGCNGSSTRSDVIELDDTGVGSRQAGIGKVQDHHGAFAGDKTAHRQVAQLQMATGSGARNGDCLEGVDREEQRGGEERTSGFNDHAGGRSTRRGDVKEISRQRATDGKRDVLEGRSGIDRDEGAARHAVADRRAGVDGHYQQF